MISTMTSIRPFLAALIAVVALSAAGCIAPEQPTERTVDHLGAPSFEDAWEEARIVLAGMGFQPDRQDRANRTIVSMPTTSKQWWEAWRGDVIDPYYINEASLHTIARRVTVVFEPTEHPDEWTIDVQVDVYRVDRVEPQVTSAASGLNMFSAVVPAANGEIVGFGDRPYSYIDLGRDASLEQKIAERIALACLNVSA